MALAVFLFGKVGSMTKSASRMRGDTGVQSRALLAIAHKSFVEHVLKPNPTVRVRVFAHSWNPSLGAEIDTLWAPTRSAHEPEKTTAAYKGQPARSALLSIKRVLRLKRAHEAEHGGALAIRQAGELALLMRYDLVFTSSVVRWEQLPRAQLWVEAKCCDAQHNPARRIVRAVHEAWRKVAATCPAGVKSVLDYCQVSYFQAQGMRSSLEPPHPEADYNYFFGDWLLAAPMVTIDTFAQMSPGYMNYVAALREISIKMRWLHFLFALHIHDALRLTYGVQAAFDGIDLVRMQRGKSPSCEPNVSVAHLMPTHRRLMYRGMMSVCGAMRGTVICHGKHQQQIGGSAVCATSR